MKLLIITQKVDENNDVLGFFHRWILEFAKNCEKLTVICLQKGEYHLPENVKVLSLGKEDGVSKFRYILNFYKYIWQERKNYDSVFVHMNQIYVILGGIVWRLLNKEIGLWYAHGHVSSSLKLAEKMTDIIFTSTKSGFRMVSKKIRVVGQGIDTEYFKPLDNKPKNDLFEIITVGRISPVKDYETLINATEILKKEGIKFRVSVVGGAGTEAQERYFQDIKEMVKDRALEDNVIFVGPVPNNDILKHLQRADLFVNMSYTGSLDKAILEAMACNLLILTCNESMNDVLVGDLSFCMYAKKNSIELSKKIIAFSKMQMSEKYTISNELRSIVLQRNNITQLIKNILNEYK